MFTSIKAMIFPASTENTPPIIKSIKKLNDLLYRRASYVWQRMHTILSAL